MDQSKRFRIALAAYAVIALLVWLTMDGSSFNVGYGALAFRVSFRGLTWALLALFGLRTVLHWKAEKIRAEADAQSG